NLMLYNLYFKIFGFHSNNQQQKNAFVIIITINDNSVWKNLKNVKETDVTNFIKLFEQELKYKIICDQSPKMTKQNIQSFLAKV
ncbi:hypothetical protein RFI_33936, partial [Reticulomyxa filosa]